MKFTKLFRKERIPADCRFRSRCNDKFYYSQIRSTSFSAAVSTIGPNRLDYFVAISSVRRENKNCSMFFDERWESRN